MESTNLGFSKEPFMRPEWKTRQPLPENNEQQSYDEQLQGEELRDEQSQNELTENELYEDEQPKEKQTLEEQLASIIPNEELDSDGEECELQVY